MLTPTLLVFGWAAAVGAEPPSDIPGTPHLPTRVTIGVSVDLGPAFLTSDRCIGCHKGVTAPSGEDVSIGYDWRASMMANSARDPYWHAAVRREIMDHPGAREAIEDKCSTCHMPMARTMAAAEGLPGQVFANLPTLSPDAPGDEAPYAALAADGVSCAACHQIAADGLGLESSFTGGFVIDMDTPAGDRSVYGPFEVGAGRQTIMHSATGFRPTQADHISRSELCATCHTLYTHALDGEGREIAELPEQVPYLEWRESAFAAEGVSCQDCHMPEVGAPVPVTGILGEARDNVSRHVFRGGNFFMLRMLNRYRAELGVTALPQELEAAAQRTVEHLQTSTASVMIDDLEVGDGTLSFRVAVSNLAGHKLPTAYPSRRVWLQVTVHDGNGNPVFQSGQLRPDGSIEGNDGDADPGLFEPHYQEITSSTQVQIYESVMVDAEDRVTTGLLSGVRYVKDNRILPRGVSRDGVSEDIGVHGSAATDPDFDGAVDWVRYSIQTMDLQGPVAVEVGLWFQPIGYRWAMNLADYDAFEPQRFVRYYREMADGSAVRLAMARALAGWSREVAGDAGSAVTQPG